MSWTADSIATVKARAAVADVVGYDTKLKRNGDDLVGCCCLPGHADDTPSLVVKPSKNVWHCKGCDRGGSPVDWLMHMHGLRFPEAMRKLSEMCGVALVDEVRAAPAPVKRRTKVAEYLYRSSTGETLYTIERWEPGKEGRSKDFVQRVPMATAIELFDCPEDDCGALRGTPCTHTRRTAKKHPDQVLYRLPEVLAAVAAGDPVFVCEGEKAAEAIVGLGLCATTHAGGASAKTWNRDFAEPLKGARVVLLPDNDDIGRRFMEGVAKTLTDLAGSCTTVVLPVDGKGDDAFEWVRDKGGNAQALADLVAAVEAPADENAIVDPLTDSGNAERWVRMHGNLFRFDVTRNGWLHWDGTRWQSGADGEALFATKAVARSWTADAKAAAGRKAYAEIVNHAATSEKRSRREAMLALAKAEPQISVQVEQLDANPWLLNVENGTVDLQTGKLRAHSQRDLITKRAPVVFDAKATAPKWEAFLSSSLPDVELQRFVQRFIGYAITGVIREHVLPFFWGSGGNGKGTFVETLARTLGDYASPVRSDLLLEQQGEQHPTELADLKGRRFCFASEPKKGKALNEDQVKLITGGDTIKARYMRQDFFEFTPTHKLCVLTNHQPVVKGTDNGIWRRMRLVPWTVTPTTPNLSLMDELALERPGILNWAIAGCLDWQENGLGSAGAIDSATAELRDASDLLGDFLAAAVVFDPKARAHGSVLFKAFRAWQDGRGERAWTQTAFGRAMADRRVEKIKSGGNLVYLGIGMREGTVEGQSGQFSGSPQDSGKSDPSKSPHEGNGKKPSPLSPPSLFDGQHDGHPEASDDDDSGWGNW